MLDFVESYKQDEVEVLMEVATQKDEEQPVYHLDTVESLTPLSSY